MRPCFAALAAVVLLAVAVQGRAGPPPVAPALQPGAGESLGIANPGDAAAALQRPFDDPIALKLGSGPGATRTPPDCGALLELAPHIVGTRSPADWNLLQRQLADCQALRWLAVAGQARHSAMPPRLHAARETWRWPAAIWPAISQDEVDALAGAGQTLKQASGRRVWTRVAPGRATPEGLTLAARGYTVRLQWLARGDFDGDGWEDWLLRWQARAEGGSWRAVRCVLLTRKAPAGAFTVGPEAPAEPRPASPAAEQ